MKCETNPNNCPIEVTLSLIGGKYKPVILWFLIDHPLHYAELQRLLPKAVREYRVFGGFSGITSR